MQLIAKYWAYLVPILIIQITFQIIAIFDLLKRSNEEIRGGSRVLWIIIIVFFEILGPIIYFIFGRKYNDSYQN